MTNGGHFRVVIAGAGVAGLEAAFALREIAGEALDVTLLSAQERFIYRPLVVREPFEHVRTPSYKVADLAAAAHAHLMVDAFKWLDPSARTVYTDADETLEYDALLLALGARLYAQLPHAITLEPARLGVQLDQVAHDVEHRLAKRIAFVVPSGHVWPLPIYELALLLAARVRHVNAGVEITVVSTEPSPLAVFGEEVSSAVQELFERSGVHFIAANSVQIHTPHWVSTNGSATYHQADRIIALPELCGPNVPGVPTSASRGFVSVDRHSRVHGLEQVFAAGDMTARPIKHGGLAAQQADAAAEQIAVLAGVRQRAEPCLEVAHAVLLSGEGPLYIRAHMVGGVATRSEVSDHPFWENPEKLSARYLAPALSAADALVTNGGTHR